MCYLHLHIGEDEFRTISSFKINCHRISIQSQIKARLTLILLKLFLYLTHFVVTFFFLCVFVAYLCCISQRLFSFRWWLCIKDWQLKFKNETCKNKFYFMCIVFNTSSVMDIQNGKVGLWLQKRVFLKQNFPQTSSLLRIFLTHET